MRLGKSQSPTSPVKRSVPTCRAICLFRMPKAAGRTILARKTNRVVGVLRPRDQRVRMSRSSSVSPRLRRTHDRVLRQTPRSPARFGRVHHLRPRGRGRGVTNSNRRRPFAPSIISVFPFASRAGFVRCGGGRLLKSRRRPGIRRAARRARSAGGFRAGGSAPRRFSCGTRRP